MGRVKGEVEFLGEHNTDTINSRLRMELNLDLTDIIDTIQENCIYLLFKQGKYFFLWTIRIDEHETPICLQSVYRIDSTDNSLTLTTNEPKFVLDYYYGRKINYA